MDTFEAIRRRRAVKHFDPDHKISAEEEQKLLEATIQAPTSFNIQHWRFVVLRDPELRARIRKDYGNDQAQMTDASLLILMTAQTFNLILNPGLAYAQGITAGSLALGLCALHRRRLGLLPDRRQERIS